MRGICFGIGWPVRIGRRPRRCGQRYGRPRKRGIRWGARGGVVEARVFGCPPGLGTCVQYDQKLDARLAMAVMGIQAFKAVEIGMGKDVAFLPGSKVHDEIGFDAANRESLTLGFTRKTNNAGGLEGGMTNGQPIVVRGAKKPISTLMKPLESVDLNT